MALINCPECEKKVSDQSMSCPQCGYPIKVSFVSKPHSTPVRTQVKKDDTSSPFMIIIGIFIAIFAIATCSNDKTSSSPKSSITSSGAVGGEMSTMEECKQKLEYTAQKYNVTYTVTMNERDYFSAKIVKDGIESDLLAICDKKDDYYHAMFEIPN
ncbi:zinc ribbon domain-containing protein [Acinetobacter stercoris]|nr:zinc ribbon domain-containing protein [Acinetobacter stercoris]